IVRDSGEFIFFDVHVEPVIFWNAILRCGTQRFRKGRKRRIQLIASLAYPLRPDEIGMAFQKSPISHEHRKKINSPVTTSLK
ncbi:MAG: hypothetical protein ACJ75F_06340, partial [Flavisolibacter sp.]